MDSDVENIWTQIAEDQRQIQIDQKRLQQAIMDGGPALVVALEQLALQKSQYQLQLDQYALTQAHLAAVHDASSITALEELVASLHTQLAEARS